MGSLPWDYAAIATSYLSDTYSMLDIDTGGGELLSRLVEVSGYVGPGHAIEPYAPNVPVARKQLEKHSITVHDTSKSAPSLREASFDLILCRHGGSVTPEELASLLKPGGFLVTEQVGDRTNRELRDVFGVAQQLQTAWPHNLRSAEEVFLNLGLDIVQLQSHEYLVRFADVGALVYYLKAVPWEVPGFSISRHTDALLRLHEEAESRGYAIDATYHAYLAIVTKR